MMLTNEQIGVLRSTLPATAADIAQALQIPPSRVATAIRDAKRAGVAIRSRHGLYEGPDQLDQYDLAILEHRMLKTSAGWTETLAGCFPNTERSEAASRLATDLAVTEASYDRAMAIQRLQRRREKIDAELDRLTTEEATVS